MAAAENRGLNKEREYYSMTEKEMEGKRVKDRTKERGERGGGERRIDSERGR